MDRVEMDQIFKDGDTNRILCPGISILIVVMVTILQACTGATPQVPPVPPEKPVFERESRQAIDYALPEEVEKMSPQARDPNYLIGPGDVLQLKVWQRPEISDNDIVVGPDGIISVARIGTIRVQDRTRDEVAREISTKLERYYTEPEVSLAIQKYENNKAFVLGRVQNPGVVHFPGRGTLLEALSMAGGYSEVAQETYLTKCAIIRDKDTIIWIDLNELLRNGNMALNAHIQDNDVIFIPESKSELVYILGEVHNPGAYHLTGQLTVMDALMQAGGPTSAAAYEKLFVIRGSQQGKGVVKEINLRDIIEHADLSNNVLLENNDILYMAEKGISKFNYVMKQMMPFLDVLSVTTDDLEAFGVMQELRKEIWGQEGFVSD